MPLSEKKLGRLLFLVSRAHHNQASQVFEQLGLYRGQPPVLFELGHQDGTPQVELAEKLELTPATLTNILHRMEASGLVIREPDPADKRISRVFLTPKGRDRLSRSREAADQIDRISFAGFSPEEQALMNEFLERVHTNLTSKE